MGIFSPAVWAVPNTIRPEGKCPFDEAIAFVVDDMSPEDTSALIGKVLSRRAGANAVPGTVQEPEGAA